MVIVIRKPPPHAYLRVRIWTGFTELFPFAEFDQVPDDQLSAKLESFGQEWVRKNRALFDKEKKRRQELEAAKGAGQPYHVLPSEQLRTIPKDNALKHPTFKQIADIAGWARRANLIYAGWLEAPKWRVFFRAESQTTAAHLAECLRSTVAADADTPLKKIVAAQSAILRLDPLPAAKLSDPQRTVYDLQIEQLFVSPSDPLLPRLHRETSALLRVTKNGPQSPSLPLTPAEVLENARRRLEGTKLDGLPAKPVGKGGVPDRSDADVEGGEVEPDPNPAEAEKMKPRAGERTHHGSSQVRSGTASVDAQANSGNRIPCTWLDSADWLVTMDGFLGAIDSRGMAWRGKVKTLARPAWSAEKASLYRVADLVEAVKQASGPDLLTGTFPRTLEKKIKHPDFVPTWASRAKVHPPGYKGS